MRLQQVVNDGAALAERPDVALFALGTSGLQYLQVVLELVDERGRVLCRGVGDRFRVGLAGVQHARTEFRLGQEIGRCGKDCQNDKDGENVLDFVHPAQI